MMLLMRTTLNINDALLEELKNRARAENRPMKKIVEETLRRGLAQSVQPNTKRKRHIKSYPVGIKPAYRGMSMNQLYDQLESEDQFKVAEE